MTTNRAAVCGRAKADCTAATGTAVWGDAAAGETPVPLGRRSRIAIPARAIERGNGVAEVGATAGVGAAGVEGVPATAPGGSATS
jgi:hypothetical protein